MTKKYENPLLPHARIREIFQAMLDLRHLSSATGRKAAAAVRLGDCAIALCAGLRDAEKVAVCAPDERLHKAVNLALGVSRAKVTRGEGAAELQEMLIARPLEQIYVSLGASAASGIPAVLLAGPDALTVAEWKRLLADVVTLRAPAVLVCLPGGVSGVSRLADRAGIPGIPVDAADPIALYRVAGESFGRARADGGPALIEALTLPGSDDALSLLRRQMIARGAATERWARIQEAKASERGDASSRQRTREKVH